MNSATWLPLASVLLGGFLTLSSSLLLEKYRLRDRDRRDLLSRRRGALEELERSAIDAHAKLQTTATLLLALSNNDDSPAAPTAADNLATTSIKSTRSDNQLMITALAEGTGKVEILRALSLAARVGTVEIRAAVSEYASNQSQWSRSLGSGGELLKEMETQVRHILQLIADELRAVDEASALAL